MGRWKQLRALHNGPSGFNGTFGITVHVAMTKALTSLICWNMNVCIPQVVTPAVSSVMYDSDGGANVVIVARPGTPPNTTVIWTTDGSWPTVGGESTHSALLPATGQNVYMSSTGALNARFVADGLLPSLTMTLVVPVPLNAAS